MDARRVKLLRAVRRFRTHHRYGFWRTLGISFSLSVLLLVPISGAARIDVWGGDHRVWFRPAESRVALATVLSIFAGIYVVTFLSNVVAGRMFCGWGCPVGQLSRFGEAVDLPKLNRRQKWLARTRGAAFSLLLVVSSLVWWTDLAVLWRGSARDSGIAWAAVGSLSLLAYAHGRVWRWKFCRTTCPIGLYYSFVAPARWYGVTFPNDENACVECDACDNVCPVDLAPRHLAAPVPSRGGLSIADAPGRNHCLECGDCVRACEWMMEVKGNGPVPLHLGFHATQPDEDRHEFSAVA